VRTAACCGCYRARPSAVAPPHPVQPVWVSALRASDGRTRLVWGWKFGVVPVVFVVPSQEYTSIEEPFYIYNPTTGVSSRELDVPGILYHAVDHLPSECAK
jgi:hypothetical protein